MFWEPVYYAVDEASWPQDTSESLGRFVGIADNVGASITYKILTENMKIISRLVVRTGTSGSPYQNLRANSLAPTLAPKPPNAKLWIGDVEQPVVQDAQPIEVETVEDEDDEGPSEETTGQESEAKEFLRSATEDMNKDNMEMPTINVEELIGRTFITSPDENGE